jgi:hypothetical protein
MKRLIVLAVASFVAVHLSAVVFAQAKPDFSGTWKLDQAKSKIPGTNGRGGAGTNATAPGYTITIRQTPTSLTIESTRNGTPVAATYKLDGSESTNPTGHARLMRSKSRWEGPKLVTDSTQKGPHGEIRKMSEVRSLEGKTLIVEVTRATGKGNQTSRLVFNKVSS